MDVGLPGSAAAQLTSHTPVGRSRLHHGLRGEATAMGFGLCYPANIFLFDKHLYYSLMPILSHP